MNAERPRARVWLSLVIVLWAPASGPAATPVLQTPGQLAATGEALKRYGEGHRDALVELLTAADDFARAIQRFQDDALAWATAAPEAERGSRLAAVATATLDLVYRGVSRELGRNSYAVRPLIEWMCRHLRRGPPSAFERLFHLASISLLQAADDEELLVGTKYSFRPLPPEQHILHGASRFPEESRFKLAWVLMRYETLLIASEPIAPGYLVNMAHGRFEADGGAARSLNDTIAVLTKLADDPGVGEEARLRRGVLRFLMDEPAAATTDLQPLTASSDTFIRYNAHMILGAIRTRAGELPVAAEHYRAAFTTVRATSAGTMLAATLFQLGRTSEVAEVLAQSEGLSPDTDPWRQYGMRDYRLFPAYLAQMRAMIVR